MLKNIVLLSFVLIVVCTISADAFAESTLKQSQSVYVSAYPHVFMGPRGTVFDLSITLMIRNTDLKSAITVTSVDYYDTHGKLTKKYLTSPMNINSMASKEIHITEKDTSGGMGSNFIVRWKAEKEVNAPAIEAVMIGGKGGQGISFIIQGKEISE